MGFIEDFSRGSGNVHGGGEGGYSYRFKYITVFSSYNKLVCLMLDVFEEWVACSYMWLQHISYNVMHILY